MSNGIQRWTIILSVLLGIILGVMFYITNPVIGSSEGAMNIPVSKERLIADVRALVTVDPPRHSENVASLDKCAEYIYNQFQAAGFKPTYQKFMAEGKEYKNIVAMIMPIDEAMISDNDNISLLKI